MLNHVHGITGIIDDPDAGHGGPRPPATSVVWCIINYRMSWKSTLKEWLNKLLLPLDIEVRRRWERQFLESQYRKTAQEMEMWFNHFVLPLPENKDRARLLTSLMGTGVSEALYIVAYLHDSLKYPGDVCEFGVATGATSALLASEILPTSRTLWLFDSFEGLPEPSEKDQLKDDIFQLGSIQKYRGKLAFRVQEVQKKLDQLAFPSSRLRIVKGFIEDTVRQNLLPDQVAFAYIDFDFYSPILTALHFLHSRLHPGGTVVVDDYDFFSTGAKTAVDEFLQSHSDRYLFLQPHPFAGPFCILKKKKTTLDPARQLEI